MKLARVTFRDAVAIPGDSTTTSYAKAGNGHELTLEQGLVRWTVEGKPATLVPLSNVIGCVELPKEAKAK